MIRYRIQWGNEIYTVNKFLISQSLHNSILAGETHEEFFLDYVETPLTEEVDVDDSIYRTTKEGEKVLVKEQRKTIQVATWKTTMTPVVKCVYGDYVIIQWEFTILSQEEYDAEIEKLKAPREQENNGKKS